MDEIREMIQTCDLMPSEDSIGRLLEICEMLNKKTETLESQLKKVSREPPKPTRPPLQFRKLSER